MDGASRAGLKALYSAAPSAWHTGVPARTSSRIWWSTAFTRRSRPGCAFTGSKAPMAGR
jgi:hypothetical protein